MENLFNEQPENAAPAPSADVAAVDAEAPDSQQEPMQEPDAEQEIAPRKWAKMFDSPEKLEEAYGHIYRAYHAKCRELAQTQQAMDGITQMMSQNTPGSPAAPVPAMLPQQGFAPGFAPDTQAQPAEMALLAAVMQAQAEAQQARELGEKFIITSLENQARDFFRSHSELGAGEDAFSRFASELSTTLGPVDADSMLKMPESLERAYRIITYPEAMREARAQREQAEQDAERFVVEGGGGGSMSVPRNQARETSFRALVQRLKRESGLA